MKLQHGLHLAYCTNIHRGETWPQIFDALQRHTLAVRDRVRPGRPYAIGLRLSDQASRELIDSDQLLAFQKWLEREACYVFTINGFPFGRFHGTRVKEQVYLPDWTTPERLEYTNRLFDLLARLVPAGVAGSVSTVPGSFKEFKLDHGQVRAMRANLWRCVEHLDRLSARTGKRLHLGLEPEPLCFLETSAETVRFFEDLRADRPGDPRLDQFLGVNYDTCHLAVEFEEPKDVVTRFAEHGVKISKLHFSSALKVRPNPETIAALEAFQDEVYCHQVIARSAEGQIVRYRDLDLALRAWEVSRPEARKQMDEEWRIHFHVPLHCAPTALWDNTSDHILGVMDLLQANPALCEHVEMETYTWEVLPPELKSRGVVDHLVGEYEWCLAELDRRGLGLER